MRNARRAVFIGGVDGFTICPTVIRAEWCFACCP
jgi:hypothetical protein